MPSSGHPRALLPVTLTAIGVVYGDIGTSPLYAMRECFFGPHAVPVSRDNVLGVLSLIVWTLVIVAQIALTVAFPVLAFFIRRDATQIASLDVGFADREYLSARLLMDSPDGDSADGKGGADLARYTAAVDRLKTLLADDPHASGVTYGDQ